MTELLNTELFTVESGSIAYPYIIGYKYPWEILPMIKSIILDIAPTLPDDEYDNPTEGVYISRSARIHPSAVICGPTIIMSGAEVRPSAFIRGSALVGRGAVVGNSTELKNCILFDGVQVPHFNYVGDSILGYKSHMGAGAITSNVKSDKSNVALRYDDMRIETGLRKLGAILGDYVEVGCNCVLNPGTVIGRCSSIYPLSSVRGFVPAETIFKSADNIVRKQL